VKITYGLKNAERVPGTITTLGSYDGVHLGHQQILAKLATRKRELGLARSVLMTFHPHPQQVLKRGGNEIELLTTIDERLALLSQLEIDETIVIEFTREFSQTTFIDFFKNIIVDRLGTAAMVVGFNHAFGKNREGDPEHLRQIAPEYGMTIEELQPVLINGVAISSTKIRNALKSSDLSSANAWLGRPYSFSGKVIHGDALGRTLGFPTANLEIATSKLIPSDGVYAATVDYDGRQFRGALSIGTKPTVTDAGERTVEALLLDFEGDLYDKTLTVSLKQYLRPQRKYSSLDELRAAIDLDVKVIRNIA
jgi:riboflavin kinase / FMN adenylyltransferase